MKIYIAYPEENPILDEIFLSIYKGSFSSDLIVHEKSIQELTNQEKDLLLEEIIKYIDGLANTLDIRYFEQFLQNIKKEKNNG